MHTRPLQRRLPPCARRHWRMRRRPPPLLPLAPLSSLRRPRCWWQIRSTNQRHGEWSLPRYSVRGRPGRAPRPTERWWLRTRTRLQRSTRSQLGAVAGLGAARAIKFLPMASRVTQCMPWDTVTQNPSGDVLAVVAEEEVADGLARARRLASCEEGAKPYTLLCEANPQLQPCPKLLTLRLALMI